MYLEESRAPSFLPVPASLLALNFFLSLFPRDNANKSRDHSGARIYSPAAELPRRTLPQRRRFILQQRNGNGLRDRRRHAPFLLFRKVYGKRDLLLSGTLGRRKDMSYVVSE